MISVPQTAIKIIRKYECEFPFHCTFFKFTDDFEECKWSVIGLNSIGDDCDYCTNILAINEAKRLEGER